MNAALSVSRRDDGRWVVTDPAGKVVSDHDTNSQAWRAADRASNEPINSREDFGEWSFRRKAAASGLGKPKKPFFTWPLERLVEAIGPMADGIRTLPDHQLSAEIEMLRSASGEGAGIPERTMLAIYEAEAVRRGDPELQYDDGLDLALGRLERQTNPADRAYVQDVGRALYAIGGRAAMERAYQRMMARARKSKSGIRQTMLSKRWAGIAR